MQEESSVFLVVIVSDIVRQSFLEHLPDSE